MVHDDDAAAGGEYKVIVPSQSETVEEQPRMAGFPRDLFQRHMLASTPLNLSHANCCISTTFDLRIHMHERKKSPAHSWCGRLT